MSSSRKVPTYVVSVITRLKMIKCGGRQARVLADGEINNEDANALKARCGGI